MPAASLTAPKKQREGLTGGSGISVLGHLGNQTPSEGPSPSGRSSGRPQPQPRGSPPGGARCSGPGWGAPRPPLRAGGRARWRPRPPGAAPPEQRLSGGGGPRPGARRRDGGGDGRGAAAGWQLPLPALPAALDDRHRLRHDPAGRKAGAAAGERGGPRGARRLLPTCQGQFQRANLYLFIYFFLFFKWVTLGPSTIPYSYLGLFGTFLRHIAEHYHTWVCYA